MRTCSWKTPTKKARKWSNISMKKYHPSPMVGVRSGIVRLHVRGVSSEVGERRADVHDAVEGS